jgi:hypothetical protein
MLLKTLIRDRAFRHHHLEWSNKRFLLIHLYIYCHLIIGSVRTLMKLYNTELNAFFFFFTCVPRNQCISLSFSLWLYSHLDLGHFFSFLIYPQLVGLLGRGISLLQGCYLHTEQHKHRINAHRHPCLEWDSNPWSQCSSRRRRFMP